MKIMHGRHVDRRLPVSYTSQAFEGWKAEVLKNPLDITQLQTAIAAHQRELGVLEPQRNALVTQQIAPIDNRILALQSQIKVLTIPPSIHDLNQQIRPHEEHLRALHPQLDGVRQVIAPIDAEIGRLNIFIDITQSQMKIGDAQAEIAHNQDSIRRHDKELHELEHEHRHAKNELDSAKSRLSSLRSQQSMDSIGHIVHAYDHHGHHGHHGGYGSMVHNINDMALSGSIATLQSTVNDLENKHHHISDGMHELERKISGHQRDEAAARGRLQELQRHLSRLQSQVAGYSFTNNMGVLQASLAQKNAEKSPHDAVRRRLEGEIQHHKHEIDYLRQNILQLQSDYDRCLPLAAEFAGNQNIADLNMQLQAAQATRNELMIEKSRLDAVITGHHQGIANANQGIQTKTFRQQELLGNQYLLKLRDQPEMLVNEITGMIRSRFADYEAAHPANQGEAIRICLAETVGKLGIIYGMPVDSDEAARKKYYQLCGLLWEILDRVDAETSLGLADEIMAILHYHPINDAEARNEYHLFRKVNPELLRDMTAADLVNMQYAEYDAAYQNLNAALAAVPADTSKAWRDLRECGQEVLTSINSHKLKAVDKGDPHFDIKFHTTVLNKTAQLVNEPGNQQLQREYHNLTEHNQDGKPSLAKKICGGMLMFLGAALLVASVVANVLSVGVSTPLSCAGIVGGSVMLLTGMGLFGWGMQKGTSRKMAHFETASVRAGVTPRFMPTVTPGKVQQRSEDIDDDVPLKQQPKFA
jgi:predicted  nucleic acid-binding Zn-ribbon protein